MAESLDVGVPWIMCQENDAPEPMVFYFTLVFSDSIIIFLFFSMIRFFYINFPFYYFLYRSTHVTVGIAIVSPLIVQAFQKCGPRIGLAGSNIITSFRTFFLSSFIFFKDLITSMFIFLGLRIGVEEIHVERRRILLFLLRAFSNLVARSKIITWLNLCS